MAKHLLLVTFAGSALATHWMLRSPDGHLRMRTAEVRNPTVSLHERSASPACRALPDVRSNGDGNLKHRLQTADNEVEALRALREKVEGKPLPFEGELASADAIWGGLFEAMSAHDVEGLVLEDINCDEYPCRIFFTEEEAGSWWDVWKDVAMDDAWPLTGLHTYHGSMDDERTYVMVELRTRELAEDEVVRAGAVSRRLLNRWRRPLHDD